MSEGAFGFNHFNQNYQNQQYKNIVGTVCALLNRYKAVLEFVDRGVQQRALLKVEKISCKPEYNPEGLDDYPIDFFVSIGTIIKCLCHKFDETGEHKCGWYVAEVLAVGLNLLDPKLLNGLCDPMINRVGLVSQVDKRQAILTYTDDLDNQHDVLLLGSKMFISGKRVKAKQHLNKVITLNDKVYFDAVPVDAEENDKRFSWFATVGWKNIKPSIDYESVIPEADHILSVIKTISKNPKSQFIRGKGHIAHILSDEYGIAFGIVNDKGNHWQSILFHRSNVSIFKYYLTNEDSCTLLRRGDKIRFVAAAAPPAFSTQWVASYIGIDVVGAAKDLVYNTVFTSNKENLPISKSDYYPWVEKANVKKVVKFDLNLDCIPNDLPICLPIPVPESEDIATPKDKNIPTPKKSKTKGNKKK
ncbi:Enoyl-CoA hydratase, mitochondrial [Frankliniella fusca]|uniref:Enoyl-CoA hydratase, mitochondrial n=1 Tax=Frankliniella fusca TaxID=407009 RepID=A0AAE1LN01_9NEOP|nr:Enoyl-CoA hydratase, mitochondrial [Frankliniella fusca]